MFILKPFLNYLTQVKMRLYQLKEMAYEYQSEHQINNYAFEMVKVIDIKRNQLQTLYHKIREGEINSIGKAITSSHGYKVIHDIHYKINQRNATCEFT